MALAVKCWMLTLLIHPNLEDRQRASAKKTIKWSSKLWRASTDVMVEALDEKG